MLGLRGCAGFSLFEASEGYSVVSVHRLLTEVASPVVEHRLYTDARAALVSRITWAL